MATIETKTAMNVLLVEDSPIWRGKLGRIVSKAADGVGITPTLHESGDYQTASELLETRGPFGFCFFDWNIADPVGWPIHTEPLIRRSLEMGYPTGVISGSGTSLDEFEQRLKEEGLAVSMIRVNKRVFREKEKKELEGQLRELFLSVAKETERKAGCKERL